MIKRVVWGYIAVIVIVLALFASMLWLNIYYSNEIIIKNNLESETQLIASVINENYDSFKNIDTKQLRLTVIASDGKVLHDSYSDTVENHLGREEVKSAIDGNPKVVKRYSETLDRDMYYYAMKSYNDDNTDYIIVRVALFLDTAQGYAASMIPFYLLCLVIFGVVSVVLMRYITKQMKKPLELVSISLKGLNEGKYKKISLDGKDELSMVLGEVNEISEKLNENLRKLSEEQSKLEMVLNNMEEAVIALDGEDNILFINLAARTLFTCDNVIGKKVIFAIDDVTFAEKIAQADREKATVYFEHLYKERLLEITVTHTEDALENIKSVAFIKDMSKDKLAQKQRSDFFESASHELKTPLTSIQGFSEILLTQTDATSPQRKQIQRIYNEAKKLSGLLKDMLSLTELDDGKMRTSSIVDLRAVADEVVSAQLCEAEKRGVKVSVEGKGCVFAPPEEISALIDNLVSNAIRYNKPKGSVIVKIKEKGTAVLLSVVDTGIGIDEKYRTRIFERFFMVDKSHSKQNGGTGLGLAIVKHIAMNLNAEIRLESKVGEGSCFTVQIPSNIDREGIEKEKNK